MFYGGEKVKELEEAFKKHYKVDYAIAVNSATSALHCAMMSLGLDIGEEVITSPYTIINFTSILMVGGIPIFADNIKKLTDDPVSVEKNITEHTKAICAVNILGHTLFELKKIAEKYNLILIEDNSQAPDALHHNAYTGTIGDMGFLALIGIKLCNQVREACVYKENLYQKPHYLETMERLL